MACGPVSIELDSSGRLESVREENVLCSIDEAWLGGYLDATYRIGHRCPYHEADEAFAYHKDTRLVKDWQRFVIYSGEGRITRRVLQEQKVFDYDDQNRRIRAERRVRKLAPNDEFEREIVDVTYQNNQIIEVATRIPGDREQILRFSYHPRSGNLQSITEIVGTEITVVLRASYDDAGVKLTRLENGPVVHLADYLPTGQQLRHEVRSHDELIMRVDVVYVQPRPELGFTEPVPKRIVRETFELGEILDERWHIEFVQGVPVSVKRQYRTPRRDGPGMMLVEQSTETATDARIRFRLHERDIVPQPIPLPTYSPPIDRPPWYIWDAEYLESIRAEINEGDPWVRLLDTVREFQERFASAPVPWSP